MSSSTGCRDHYFFKREFHSGARQFSEGGYLDAIRRYVRGGERLLVDRAFSSLEASRHGWFEIHVVVGDSPVFGDEPDGRRRTNRHVLERIKALGGRPLPHVCAPWMVYGAERGPMSLLDWASSLRGREGCPPVDTIVFPLLQPIACFPYRFCFAVTRSPGGGAHLGFVDADPGYSWSPQTVFLYEALR